MSLASLLCKGLPSAQPKDMCKTRRRKFSKYIKLLGRSIHDLSLSGRVACFSADRDPRSGFAQVRLGDASLCIKSHCPYFVVSLGEREGHTPRICRFLHLAELCKLQGVCPSSIPAGMKASQFRRALANAMTVPVVGSATNAAMIASMSGSWGQSCKRQRVNSSRCLRLSRLPPTAREIISVHDELFCEPLRGESPVRCNDWSCRFLG